MLSRFSSSLFDSSIIKAHLVACVTCTVVLVTKIKRSKNNFKGSLKHNVK